MNPSAAAMPPWPGLAPYARTVRLPGSGLELFYYEAGAGPAAPWLLVHGLGDEADTWRHLLPALAGGARVIAPDLPGFGRSQAPVGPYSLSFFQETLLELLETLGVRRVVLAGHSLGAALVQSIALDDPPRVERLALLGGALVSGRGLPDLATLLFLVPGLGERLYNRLRRDPHAAYRSLEPYYANLPALPEADREFLFRRVNARVWSDRQRAAFLGALRSLPRSLPRLQRDLPARLAGLQVPTLAVWGAADRLSPPATGQRLAALQPSARLAIIPGAGHNLHQENPGAVLDLLTRREAWPNPALVSK